MGKIIIAELLRPFISLNDNLTGKIKEKLSQYFKYQKFQHVVFGVCRLIDLVVPDIPESLDIKIKRERYLAKEALQDADHVLQVRHLLVVAQIRAGKGLGRSPKAWPLCEARTVYYS